MHVQPPLAGDEHFKRRQRPPAWPDPARGYGTSMLKAIARAQRDCPHDGVRRPADPYSDRDVCALCALVLPLSPLPDVDLHDASDDLAWAVAFHRRPPTMPGVLALVELSRRVRRADASWAVSVFGRELQALRELGMTPASYLGE
ncbi:hypothetical protein L332_01755 [Agrococcus pavilionensis RW1]|uniref:Uncharacterized protein n=1 Tax=Agrococcus pavilionensis RW1 TaxID=1330458 RepID=U1MR98_9MICO|nr:hypothetical protein [Agrococcus pavilionensis]ERG63180.1 hypothetical protein L332_01755 [Agrococcus pavilionensis RW1]